MYQRHSFVLFLATLSNEQRDDQWSFHVDTTSRGCVCITQPPERACVKRFYRLYSYALILLLCMSCIISTHDSIFTSSWKQNPLTIIKVICCGYHYQNCVRHSQSKIEILCLSRVYRSMYCNMLRNLNYTQVNGWSNTAWMSSTTVS